MYNRYIRNDNGSYTRIPEEGPSSPGGSPAGSPPPEGFHPERPSSEERRSNSPQPEGPPPGGGSSPGGPAPNGPGYGRPPHGPARSGRPTDGLTGVLQHLLDQLHLDHVDTGDLLLLALLFFLFRENADEELLVALGLLLIL